MKRQRKSWRHQKRNIKKNIKYKNLLLNKQQKYRKMKTIQNKNHQLESYELNKVSLSCFGDKRYIHEDGIKSYPYGQRKIWRHDNMQQLWQSTYKCHNLHKQCRASSSPTREKPLFQFWRVRNHYFNSDEWETTVVVWNKLVSIWVSFTSQELISCTMHQTLADWSKKSCDYHVTSKQ